MRNSKNRAEEKAQTMAIQIKEKHIFLLMAIALPLRLLWWPFAQIEGKYDFFIFEAHAQSLKWYAHYTAYYIGEITKSFLLALLGRKFLSRKTALILTVFLIYDIFRLGSYWLFRWQFPIWIFTVSLIGLILASYYYGKNNFNKVLVSFPLHFIRRGASDRQASSRKQ